MKIYLSEQSDHREHIRQIIFLSADHQLCEGRAISPRMTFDTKEHMEKVHGVTGGYQSGNLLDMTWWLQKHLELHPPITEDWQATPESIAEGKQGIKYMSEVE